MVHILAFREVMFEQITQIVSGYPDVSSCRAIISEGKCVDINLMVIFGGMRCRLQKRRPQRVFD